MAILNQSFTEIIIAIAIVALGVIYLVIKKSKKSSIFKSIEREKPIKEELIQEVREQKEALKESGIILAATANRQKRALPKHEKITKDSFSIFNGVRILIAEDNLINQKVLIGILGSSGMDIIIGQWARGIRYTRKRH